MPRRLAPRRRKNDNAMEYPRGAKRRGRKSMIGHKIHIQCRGALRRGGEKIDNTMKYPRGAKRRGQKINN